MRRHVPFAALVLVLAGCGSAPAGDAAPAGGSLPPSSAATTTGSAPAPDDAGERFAQLEGQFGARLGVFAVDTGSGRTVAHRAGERFGFASTYKALAAGALLGATTDAELDAVVTWTAGELVAHSPVTGRHAGSGLPLREVAAASVTVSDNTAANVVLDRLGGPAGLQERLRALGDGTTEVAHGEPEVNDVAPGDVEDTSTPQALATTLRAYAVDGALEPADRAQLVEWLRGGTTGDGLIRAGVPGGWTVGDKTGRTGSHGSLNDLGVVWPGGDRAPWVLAVLSDRADPGAEPDEALLAAATEVVVAELG